MHYQHRHHQHHHSSSAPSSVSPDASASESDVSGSVLLSAAAAAAPASAARAGRRAAGVVRAADAGPAAGALAQQAKAHFTHATSGAGADTLPPCAATHVLRTVSDALQSKRVRPGHDAMPAAVVLRRRPRRSPMGALGSCVDAESMGVPTAQHCLHNC